MKSVIFIWLLIFLCIDRGFSQSDFRPGYLINNNNDKTFGLIDYKGNKANAKKCLFKSSENSDVQEFTPADLKAYRLTGSKYYCPGWNPFFKII
jgi:hypothetical protein